MWTCSSYIQYFNVDVLIVFLFVAVMSCINAIMQTPFQSSRTGVGKHFL
jgi:hypothetical protein